MQTINRAKIASSLQNMQIGEDEKEEKIISQKLVWVGLTMESKRRIQKRISDMSLASSHSNKRLFKGR